MRDFISTLVGFARDTVHDRRPDQFHDGASALLERAIGADQVFWAETDFSHGTAIVRGDSRPGLRRLLGTLGPTHPAIQSYVRRPSDLSPRRVSDVTEQRTWLRSPMYRQAFAEFGPAHQMSLVTAVRPPAVGRGWTLTRASRDFSDSELDLATRVFPVLVTLDETLRPSTSVLGAGALSRRERQVLALLADGMTAASIAWRCGITERTVRKHLASIYDKLDCGDRLVAVRRAAQLGLLEPPPPPRPEASAR